MDCFRKRFLTAVLLIGLTGVVQGKKHEKRGPEVRCGVHLHHKGPRLHEQAFPGEFPFLVQVEAETTVRTGYENGAKSITFSTHCSGVLIKSDVVFTSADCGIADNYKLTFGDHLSDFKKTTVKVLAGEQEVSRRPFPSNQYNCSVFENSITVLYLAPKITFTVPKKPKKAIINRVCIDDYVSAKEIAQFGQRVTVAGWYEQSWKNIKAFETNTRKCQEEANKKAICLDEDLNSNKFKGLLKGAALVRDNGHKEWELLGLYTEVLGQREFIDIRNAL